MKRNNHTKEETYLMMGGNTGLLPDHITPSRIDVLKINEVFVFGSNTPGIHICGAARVVYGKC